jgi:hypothetical protein
MKRLILPIVLLLTGCAGVQHKDSLVKNTVTEDVPVFLAFGPNLVGYETIIFTSLNDCNIPVGAKMACNFVSAENDHLLVEGTLYKKDPMLFDTQRGFALPLTTDYVEFCLMTDSQMEKSK